MPELPDVLAYLTGLQAQIGGRTIDAIHLRSAFLVRTFEPRLETAAGRRVIGFQRLGKRIVWELEDELFLVIHLMIAGRFHWRKPGTRATRKIDLAAFQFDTGTMMLTEAGSKKRASLHVVAGADGLTAHDPGGLEVLEADLDTMPRCSPGATTHSSELSPIHACSPALAMPIPMRSCTLRGCHRCGGRAGCRRRKSPGCTLPHGRR